MPKQLLYYNKLILNGRLRDILRLSERLKDDEIFSSRSRKE